MEYQDSMVVLLRFASYTGIAFLLYYIRISQTGRWRLSAICRVRSSPQSHDVFSYVFSTFIWNMPAICRCFTEVLRRLWLMHGCVFVLFNIKSILTSQVLETV